jgi:hypothetical protein
VERDVGAKLRARENDGIDIKHGGLYSRGRRVVAAR